MHEGLVCSIGRAGARSIAPRAENLDFHVADCEWVSGGQTGDMKSMRGELNCVTAGRTFEPDHKEVTMKKRMTKIAALTIPLTIVCGLLVPAVSSAAENENGRACSNRSLSGRF